MNALYFMVPLALLLAIAFVGFFVWATRNGQFDDLDTPPERMLLEDENINNNNVTRASYDRK